MFFNLAFVCDNMEPEYGPSGFSIQYGNRVRLKMDTMEIEWDLGLKPTNGWRLMMDSMELDMENDLRMEVRDGDE
jgi:hypothetical protein